MVFQKTLGLALGLRFGIRLQRQYNAFSSVPVESLNSLIDVH